MHKFHAVRAVVAINLLAIATPLAAQTAPPLPQRSTSQDAIERAKEFVGRAENDSAITLAKDLLSVRELRSTQQTSVLQILGAAYFPEIGGVQNVDSARSYLGKAIRSAPDAPLSADLRWKGLDSLFAEVRSSVFAVVAHPNADNAMAGTDARAAIEVVATRPSNMRLVVIERSTGRTVVHDSARNEIRAKLGMRAHDGRVPLFRTGEYELRVLVQDVVTNAVDTIRFTATAVGSPPDMQPLPALPIDQLKPERSPRKFAAGIAGGLFLGSATIAIARYAGSMKPVSTAAGVDSRANILGVLIAGAGAAGGFFDKGRPIHENIVANAGVRAENAHAVAEVEAANRRRASDYRVTLTIALREAR